MARLKCILIVMGAIFMAMPCMLFVQAQEMHHDMNEFKPLPGLPSKITFSVFKDSRGFMWFGTENGLYRYNGYEFRPFQHDPLDSTSISSNLVGSILFEDCEGNIWIGTMSNGLNIFDPKTETFKRFKREPDYRFDFTFDQIIAGLQDSDGEVWLVTGNAMGLIHFDINTGNHAVYKPDTSNSPEAYSNRLSSLYEDSKGKLWVGTYAGAFIFNKEKKTFIKLGALVDLPKELIDQPVGDIVEDQDGNFWIGSNQGLLKYNPHEHLVELFKHDPKDFSSLGYDMILTIFDNPLDSGKSLWVITRLGINRLDKQSAKFTRFNYDPKDPVNRAFDAMFDVYLEDNGILWVASGFAGAVKYDLKISPFTEYSIGPFDGDPYRYEATSFFHDREGYFWVGTGYGGLFKFDKNLNQVHRYQYEPENPNTLSYNFIYSLFEDSDGVLWIGSASNLDVLDKQKDRIIRCTLPEVMHYDYTRANEILQDSYGTLWIAATGGAYYQNKEYELDTSFLRASLDDDPLIEIRCIAEDSSGSIWLGTTTGQGLYLLTPENRDSMIFINYQHMAEDPKSLGDNVVWSLYTDSDGILWCGTSNGLYSFDPKTDSFIHFNRENGLIANFIYNIKGDKLGNLWLSTEKGIVRFTQVSDSTALSKLLEREDGVPFNDNYQFKIYKDPDGRIYVGGRRYTGDGFYFFDPAQLKDNDHIPPVVFTKLLVKNKPVQLDTSIMEIQHLLLKHNQNYFSFEFAALDYINPSKNLYAYMLEGFDEDWIYSGNRRLANYTNVPPGDYTFRVKGSNNDGVWNEEGTSVKISIAAPPWKTGWAYSLYFLFIIAVFYIILRVYLNRQKILHDLALKHLEAEKLEELHHEKSKFFSNISHEFRTPLTLIIGPVKRAISQMKDKAIIQDLQISLNNAFRLQNLINQLLSLSKIESGKLRLKACEEDIVSLVRGYYQSFESSAREKGIELNFNAEPDEIPVFVDREKLEQILYNLISNALKFTPAGSRIELAISQQESSVVSRQSSVVSRQSSVISRQSSVVSRQSLVNNDTSTEDCRLKTEDLPENCAVISITDTGNGIAPQHLPHLFDRFYQVDDSYTRNQEGTGIGLALVKELVELHHGTITVNSEVGKGTTFFVLLPLGRGHLREEEVDTSRQSSVVSRQSAPTPALSNLDASPPGPLSNLERGNRGPGGQGGEAPLLLIVEDNRDMRHYLRSCLDASYRVEEAEDGEKGLEMALELIPDLVISDVMMPKMNGYQLCDQIKTDERTSHIPLILLTALATPESKIEGLETGADDFLSKPFDATELQVRVKNLIDQRRKLSEKFMKNANRLGISNILELPDPGMASMDEKFLQKTLEVIQQHLPDPDFHVDNLSDQMHMSRSQLYRKIHALTGLSPNEFIRYNRLQKAVELLRHQTGNIAGIAYEVGFNNPSYFTECFKKQFGVLPSDYK